LGKRALYETRGEESCRVKALTLCTSLGEKSFSPMRGGTRDRRQLPKKGSCIREQIPILLVKKGPHRKEQPEKGLKEAKIVKRL